MHLERHITLEGQQLAIHDAVGKLAQLRKVQMHFRRMHDHDIGVLANPAAQHVDGKTRDAERPQGLCRVEAQFAAAQAVGVKQRIGTEGIVRNRDRRDMPALANAAGLEVDVEFRGLAMTPKAARVLADIFPMRER